jgi:polyferredoxin
MQFITLAVFVLLIVGAARITTDDAVFAKTLRNTNLANLIVWSYWWPLIIASAVLFGRFWCSICPMEMITSFFGKIGLKRKPGKVLKSGWVITIFYAVILIVGIHTFQIHRIPQLMAIYMLILLAVAVIAGFIWEKRTFCTYVCPIGHLLGLYSMVSFKKLRVKDSAVCNSCQTKDCISTKNHYKFIGRSCTSELFPPKITDNRKCILCGQCYKSCPNDNIVITKKKLAADLFKDVKLSWAEIGFFMIVSAFVVYEILSEWSVSKHIIMALPDFMNSILNVTGRFTGTVKAVSLFVLLPAIFFFGLALLKKVFAKENFKDAVMQLVFVMLPVTASMHLLKAILKTTSRIPYWKYVFADPEGVETAKAILQNHDMLNNHVLSAYITPVVNILSILIPLSGLILAFFVIKKMKHTGRLSQLISIFTSLFYASIFIITLIWWRILG